MEDAVRETSWQLTGIKEHAASILKDESHEIQLDDDDNNGDDPPPSSTGRLQRKRKDGEKNEIKTNLIILHVQLDKPPYE